MFLDEQLFEQKFGLKQYTINTQLQENLQTDHDTYYKEIPEDIFLALVQQDPTTQAKSMQDNKGKYSKWLLDKYKKGIIQAEDIQSGEIKQVLDLFEKRRRGTNLNRDINHYKSIDDLMVQLSTALNIELSEKQKSRYLEAAAKQINLDDYKVYETKNWVLYHATDRLLLIRLGRKKNNECIWCIAATEGNLASKYAEYVERLGEGFAYVLINKNNPEERYCICEGTGEFNNAYNNSVDTELFDDPDILDTKMYSYLNLHFDRDSFIPPDEDDAEDYWYYYEYYIENCDQIYKPDLIDQLKNEPGEIVLSIMEILTDTTYFEQLSVSINPISIIFNGANEFSRWPSLANYFSGKLAKDHEAKVADIFRKISYFKNIASLSDTQLLERVNKVTKDLLVAAINSSFSYWHINTHTVHNIDYKDQIFQDLTIRSSLVAAYGNLFDQVPNDDPIVQKATDCITALIVDKMDVAKYKYQEFIQLLLQNDISEYFNGLLDDFERGYLQLQSEF